VRAASTVVAWTICIGTLICVSAVAPFAAAQRAALRLSSSANCRLIRASFSPGRRSRGATGSCEATIYQNNADNPLGCAVYGFRYHAATHGVADQHDCGRRAHFLAIHCLGERFDRSPYWQGRQAMAGQVHGNAAIVSREVLDLRCPVGQIATEPVHEKEGRATGAFDSDVDRRGRHLTFGQKFLPEVS
jgi:hypothetical protein